MSYQGFFSRLEDAGKFVIAAVGDYLRIARRLDPIAWKWMDEGLAPEVEEFISSDSDVRYQLRSNPDAYFVITLGDRPASHILPMTYEQLTEQLLQGFPEDTAPVQ